MIIILHVVIALVGLGLSTALFVRQTQVLLRASYATLALTIASGTYVAWANHTNILSTCVTGLLYLGAVSVGILFARHKLAHAFVKNQD